MVIGQRILMEALNKSHYLIIRHSGASRTKSPGAILNSFSWPAQRAYTMEGIRNPVKTISYWMPSFDGMTVIGLLQRFLITIGEDEWTMTAKSNPW